MTWIINVWVRDRDAQSVEPEYGTQERGRLGLHDVRRLRESEAAFPRIIGHWDEFDRAPRSLTCNGSRDVRHRDTSSPVFRYTC